MIVTKDDRDRASFNMPRKSIRKEPVNNKTVPHITNLHEDPMMSGIVYYALLKGELTIGRRTGNPVPDVIIGATGVQKNHAKIKLLSNGIFELQVVPEGATSTAVNGEHLTV